jgi:hypothetical protein
MKLPRGMTGRIGSRVPRVCRLGPPRRGTTPHGDAVGVEIPSHEHTALPPLELEPTGTNSRSCGGFRPPREKNHIDRYSRSGRPFRNRRTGDSAGANTWPCKSAPQISRTARPIWARTTSRGRGTNGRLHVRSAGSGKRVRVSFMLFHERPWLRPTISPGRGAVQLRMAR